MNNPTQLKALGIAFVAIAFSLGGTGLAAVAIQKLNSFDPMASIATAAAPIPGSALSTSPELLAQGHDFFEMTCSQCHGDDAHGDEGPDLHNLAISNARISSTIKNGIKGEMPTFGKRYNDQQIATLVAYLRSLK